jgi:hypothetical protein
MECRARTDIYIEMSSVHTVRFHLSVLHHPRVKAGPCFHFIYFLPKDGDEADSETGKHNYKLQTMGNVQETFQYLQLSVMYSKLKLYHALQVLLTWFPFSFSALFA